MIQEPGVFEIISETLSSFSSFFDISLTIIDIFFLSKPVVNIFGFLSQSLSTISSLTFFVAVAVKAIIGK
ncbi:MAG: hypothetical protein P1U46_04250 [Patescibacteria group bacterium]|nr:hypothetical protein [Patescibacteria group bacterium]